MMSGVEVLAALPTAVYTTDLAGRITFYNEAAAELWGRHPAVGTDRWSGAWRLYWPDGRPLPHDECPVAVVLRENTPLDAVEVVAARPDGTRVPYTAHPRLVKDASGRVTGTINLLLALSDHRQAEIDSARLAAIVASSDDAIVSKSLDGQVTSWNAGAVRIFGYQPEEMIGQSIKRIIPPELHHEEDKILARLQRGERIEHFDTVRVTKDGRRIDVSLTVSPVRDRAGNIVGASKVARDVTERKRGEQVQRLLLAELSHRVKNTLAMIQSIANQSLRRASSPTDFVASFNGRVQALARAHDLLVQKQMKGADLMDIVREQVVLGTSDRSRVTCAGSLVGLDGRTAVNFALVLHELATNARKYGALSVATGELSISWKVLRRSGRELVLEWRERGVPLRGEPRSRGFGTTLIERTAEASGGTAELRFDPDGLVCEISVPLPEEEGATIEGGSATDAEEQSIGSVGLVPSTLHGKRILVIEDEPLVGLEIEALLSSFGCEVIGPATTIQAAQTMVENSSCDAALVDANLAGHRVDEIAAALQRRAIPFVFATGYGREALPVGFGDVPVLVKPFTPDQLLSALHAVVGEPYLNPEVVSLHADVRGSGDTR